MQTKFRPEDVITPGTIVTIPTDPKRAFREAFLKAKTAFKSVLKTQENPFFKSSYADLSDYHDAVDTALQTNGFALHQLLESDGTSNYLVTKLTHVTGHEEVSRILIKSKDDSDPQKLGSAITYLRRYSIAAILGVPSEDDDGTKGAETPVEPTDRTDKTITEGQVKRLWAIAKTAGRNEDDVRQVLSHFRYEHTKDITKRDYDLIIAALEPRK